MRNYRSFHLFCGMGGDALGFQSAGWEVTGAVDRDEGACRDFERLTGVQPTRMDVTEAMPADIRNACNGRPHVVITSPPCKGNSSCLPAEKAEQERYQELNSLSQLGIWLTLEAWETPPPIILLENVERITSRSREWLDDCIKLLREYGYATEETRHDCGRLGGLAQSRKRYMLIARHQQQVPEFVYEPPSRELKGVGDVLASLPVPVPGDEAGGPMHRLPKLSAMNWLRLASIPAGGDFRDLPESIGVCDGYNKRYGVTSADEEAATVRASHSIRTAEAAWADPRVSCDRREGSLGVTDWQEASACLIGHARIHNWPAATADPRRIRPTHRLVETDRRLVLAGPSLDLESQRSADPVPIIESPDRTWHRPFTTLELARLQGFPARLEGEWLELEGSARADWRERIGNAIPPPTAEAIAKSCEETLDAANDDEFLMRAEPVWVDSNRRR